MNPLFLKATTPENQIEVGKKAPDFRLTEDSGNEWSLSENLGKVIVLLFYPKNETLVCTRQLCSIRDNWSDYLKTEALVVGVSNGSRDEHRAFAAKYRLPMPLLVDEQGKITKVFGQHSWLPAAYTRAIVVIDANGIIRHRNVMFSAFRPSDYQVLSAIYEARTEASQEKYNQLLQNHRDKKNAGIKYSSR